MRRHFGTGDSNGPNVNNLQHTFWQLAVERFEALLKKWENYTVYKYEDELEEYEYTEDNFVVDTAVVLILAGTSISHILGQNTDPEGDRVLSSLQAYQKLLGYPASGDIKAFIDVYDALRHFVSPKFEAVDSITPDKLCKHLRTAQSIWCEVLKRRGEQIGEHLQIEFTFPE